MQQKRHLAAILFTDIIGYTAMMQENEVQAVAMVKRYLAFLHALVPAHSGKILDDYGDGSLCVFPSAIEAVRAAMDLQNKLKEEPSIPLRIGLHIGEIFFEDGKVFGDGVNVASRIQSLGEANAILLSGEVNNKISNHPEFSSVSLGRFEFKNVNEAVEVFALTSPGLTVPKRDKMTGKLKVIPKKFSKRTMISVAVVALLFIAVVLVYNRFQHPSKFTGKEKSIAVLPFTNMSSDKENEYFSDGMTEEITTQLSKISDLKVIARTSSMLYKGSQKSIKQIAEELDVSAILEGSVQKAGNSIRITAQLIDANTQEHIWADKYDRDLKDIFKVQSEVAMEIAYRLNAKLTSEERKRLKKIPTSSPEAYQFYLQGDQLHNSFIETMKPEYFDNSKALFEKALAIDSNYAIAHASLADLYNTYTNLFKKDSLLMTSQLSEIQKAWKIDSTNDYVISVMGVIEQTTVGNKEKGFILLKKAIEINPNNPDNLWSLAFTLGFNFGLFDESLLLMNEAIKLDPIISKNFHMRGNYNYILNKPENALKDFETAIRLEPQFVRAFDNLSQLYVSMGKLDEAKKILMTKSFQLKPSMADHQRNVIGFVYAKLGDKEKALELAPNDWRILLALGMSEEAIKAMPFYNDTDNRTNTPYLTFKSQLSTKDFDPIRNDPRFLKILERSKQKYEENKKKYSVMDIINSLPSSVP